MKNTTKNIFAYGAFALVFLLAITNVLGFCGNPSHSNIFLYSYNNSGVYSISNFYPTNPSQNWIDNGEWAIGGCGNGRDQIFITNVPAGIYNISFLGDYGGQADENLVIDFAGANGGHVIVADLGGPSAWYEPHEILGTSVVITTNALGNIAFTSNSGSQTSFSLYQINLTKIVQPDNNQTNLPIVSIVSPTNRTYDNGTILLNATSNQQVSWKYNLNNGSNVSFVPGSYINLGNGNYSLVVYGTNANGTGSASVRFAVNSSQNNIELPYLRIVFPEAKTYNSTNVLVDIHALNQNAVWFSWNGTNQAYTSPISVDFKNNGTYTLYAYANNSLGEIVSDRVTFNIDTSYNPDHDDDSDEDGDEHDDYEDNNDENEDGYEDDDSSLMNYFYNSTEYSSKYSLPLTGNYTIDLTPKQKNLEIKNLAYWLIVAILVLLIIIVLIYIFKILR